MMFPPRLVAVALASVFVFGLVPDTSEAMPAFARQYNVSCVVCHDAFPKLNAYGEQFAADNFRMPHWREKMADRWAFSMLYNYADAGDFDDTGTIFEGLAINSLTFGASYYFMRNLKGVIEVNADLLGKDSGGPPFVGHQTREHYLLIGIDAAY